MQTIQQPRSWFSRQKLIVKLAIGCVGLFFLCCICSIPLVILSSSAPTPESAKATVVKIIPSQLAEATSTKTATVTIAPTETEHPTVSPSNTPKPTATKETIALLPGLMPADVTVNLEQRGFTCGSVEQGQGYYVRTCDKRAADYSLHVEVYGRQPFSVDFIDSTVVQFGTPDNDDATSFLGFMATMPYDGAVQQEARNWVEDTLPLLKGEGDVREKTFAGVTYRLFGTPTASTLEMGDLP